MSQFKGVTFAPTSAGKSYYALQHPKNVFDGDRIIKLSIGWPQQKEWWKDDVIGPAFNIRSLATILLWARDNQESEVVFNAKASIAGEMFGDSGLNVRVVIPPEDILLRNVELKAEEQLLGRKLGQPIDVKSILHSAETWRETARLKGWPIFSSFENGGSL